MSTIFTKIINKEIPAEIVYEDELCLAFKDIQPQAPTHILVIPKIEDVDRLQNATDKHKELLGHLLMITGTITKDLNLKDYRVVINNGEGAGQSVFHLHLHILGGRPLSWPPG